jgi:hypothetical protein
LFQNPSTNCWDIIKRRLKNIRFLPKIYIKNSLENHFFQVPHVFPTFFWWYFSHLLVYCSHGQPKSTRGPHFWKIAILRAKIWAFSKDLIDFAPK